MVLAENMPRWTRREPQYKFTSEPGNQGEERKRTSVKKTFSGSLLDRWGASAFLKKRNAASDPKSVAAVAARVPVTRPKK